MEVPKDRIYFIQLYHIQNVLTQYYSLNCAQKVFLCRKVI